MTLTLTSTAFTDGGAIPRKYTCEGDDISPPLAWSGVPAGTQSLALIVDDPDAPDPAKPQRVWVHWVLYNLPPDSTGLAEGIATSALPVAPGRASTTGTAPAMAAPARPSAGIATSTSSMRSTRGSTG